VVVLTTVLAHAGRVAGDVAGRRSRAVEGGCQQPEEPELGHGQEVERRAERRGDALGPRARPRRPCLGEEVDPALAMGGRAERRTVVEVRAAVPGAIPGARLRRLAVARRTRALLRRLGLIAARLGERREALEDDTEEPRQPDALAASAVSDAIETVVPIASSDQRQAVLPLGRSVRERAPAVLVERTALGRRRVLVVAFELARRELLTGKERHALVEHGASPVAVT
jgi:hypothetical protein